MMTTRRNKKDRKRIIADYWSKPSSHELDVVDKGDHLEVASANPDVAAWWLGTLRAVYPQDLLSGSGEVLKMHPAMGVTLKLNKEDGTLKIKGRKHMQWFNENFERVMEFPETPYDAIGNLAKMMDSYLKLDDSLSVNNLLSHLPPTGAIKHGPTYVYRLWRGLLDEWIAGDGHIYIISPLMDSKRLADILLLIIKHRLAHSRVHIYTMPRCSGEDKFERVFKEAKDMLRELKHTNKRRVIVEERLKQAIGRIEAKFGRFQTKLIACCQDDFSELLLTSANFHSWNFVHDNSDSVCFMRLPTDDFMDHYLDPLGLTSQFESMRLETSSISGASEMSSTSRSSYQHSECSSSRGDLRGGGMNDHHHDRTLDQVSHDGSSSTLSEEPASSHTVLAHTHMENNAYATTSTFGRPPRSSTNK